MNWKIILGFITITIFIITVLVLIGGVGMYFMIDKAVSEPIEPVLDTVVSSEI